jgi:molecular chaperone DnaJ
MGEPDYYQILGVERSAGPDEIKRAYHQLAAQFHPDLHPQDPDAGARLKSLNQAYAALRDPIQRRQYDRWGAWGPPAWVAPRSRDSPTWITAVVSHLIKARAYLEAHRPHRGSDLRYTLFLTPDEGRWGTEVQLHIPNTRWCPRCSGSGSTEGRPPTPCSRCGGMGEVFRPGGLLRSVRLCEPCQGRGMLTADPCLHCNGRGSIPVERLLSLPVPAGVAAGSRLRVQGEGAPGRWGGPSGDLFIDIRILAHPGRTPHRSPSPR